LPQAFFALLSSWGQLLYDRRSDAWAFRIVKRAAFRRGFGRPAIDLAAVVSFSENQS
jgi:hypothetical protein